VPTTNSVIRVGHSTAELWHHRGRHPPQGRGALDLRPLRTGQGQSVNTLIADPLPAPRCRRSWPPQDGFLFLDPGNFAARSPRTFTPNWPLFMADSQVPWGVRRKKRVVPFRKPVLAKGQPSWR